jgi:carbonic anhydrase
MLLLSVNFLSGADRSGSMAGIDPVRRNERIRRVPTTDELLENNRRYAESFAAALQAEVCGAGDGPAVGGAIGPDEAAGRDGPAGRDEAPGRNQLPRRNATVAVLACMDPRMDIYAMLGLKTGEAYVIRNAGGVVTDDAIRSIAISQRLLGTDEIMLIHHTDCGMLTFTDDAFEASVEKETGIKPPWVAEAFTDLDDNVRESIRRIKLSLFVPRTDSVRGFVFDVASGKLREIS